MNGSSNASSCGSMAEIGHELGPFGSSRTYFFGTEGTSGPLAAAHRFSPPALKFQQVANSRCLVFEDYFEIKPFLSLCLFFLNKLAHPV